MCTSYNQTEGILERRSWVPILQSSFLILNKTFRENSIVFGNNWTIKEKSNLFSRVGITFQDFLKNINILPQIY